MSSDDEGAVPLSRAAEWVKLPGTRAKRADKLRRILREKERELGRFIMVRAGRCLRVTKASLSRYCPELMPRRFSDQRAIFRKHLDDMDTRLVDIADSRIAKLVEPQIKELYQQDEEIAERVNELAIRLGQHLASG